MCRISQQAGRIFRHYSIISRSSPKELVDDKDSRVLGFEDSSQMPKNYKELKVWQKAYQLCLEIYRITARFPKDEKFGLTSQIRRASVSVPSNIAEGYGRKTTENKHLSKIPCTLTGNP